MSFEWGNVTDDALIEEVRRRGFTIRDAQISPKHWAGLTRAEFEQAVDGLEDLEDCWTVIEAKLKEKNT
jgi:UDP-N-acetylenolpyruvoylglucosamine reductase